jgi:hypothetical protein
MTDWNKAKVVDLRAELKKRGLPQTGLKPALVARLTAAENEDGSESEATVQDDALKLNASAATSPDTVSPTQPLSAETVPEVLPQSASEPNPESIEEAAGLQVEHVDTSMEDAPAQALLRQPADTIESSKPSSHSEPERSALPSVEPQEAIEDGQKRKRRSQTPPISASDVARKRFRPSDEAGDLKDKVTTAKSDSAWVEKHTVVDEEEINPVSGSLPDRTNVDVVKADAKYEDKVEVTMESKPNLEGTHTSSEPLEDSPSRTRDSRFKDLFPSQQTAPAMGVRMEKSKSRDSAYDETEPERIISPAIHPATAALYIRDFMRPLNPAQLKSHLARLATPPGRDADQDVVVDFYLDPIRTHAFVSFKNISAASRVRSALHDRIWPDERTRKPLWVDFIPLEKVERWIEEEESTKVGGRSSRKKWEVYYDVDDDRHVTATLQEAGKAPNMPHIRRPSVQIPSQAPPVPASAPVAPRGIEGAPSGPRAEQNRGQRAANNLATLDQLFRSTVAKPVLYWEPVSKTLANKRLDAVDDVTSKRYVKGSSATGAINRYTFDDGDQLVDRGPEIFSGIRPPPGFRGPGRGGFAGVRGSRGGYGGGDRAYDSYRGGGGGGGGGRRGSRDNRGSLRDSRDDRDDWRDSRDDRRY